jgi:predicted nucleic acid-binding protein
MDLLFDTNVILDVLLNREPWVKEASALWKANDEGALTGYVVASSFTDIFYVARRLVGLESARAAVRLCLEAFAICPADRQSLERAESLSGGDFEDNLQIACAQFAGVDAIATRDKEGFGDSPVPVLSPAEALAQLRL